MGWSGPDDSAGGGGIDADAILQHTLALGPARQWRVAFSGGPDSHALLHALAGRRERLGAPLTALHVNHALHPDADLWEARCRRQCADLGVPLTVCRANPEPGDGGLETRARDARYRAFSETLDTGDVLLTAHHRDDQAETVLLRLLRGAGVDGLGGIPAWRALGAGRIARPLLDVSRATLRAYHDGHGLESIHDPGNAAPEADRNYLRHTVLPLLRARWPAAERTLADTAQRLGEAAGQLRQYADHCGAGQRDGLDCAALAARPADQQRLVLRRWLQRHGRVPPHQRQLDAALGMLLGAAADRSPVFDWPGGRLRRHRGLVLLDPPAPPAPPVPPGDQDGPWRWQPDRPLALPGGRLIARRGGPGLDPEAIPAEGLEVVFRAGGERVRPRGRRSRPLKKLFQEAGIPPWQRPSWPLLRLEGTVIAVPGICLCDTAPVVTDSRALTPVWERH